MKIENNQYLPNGFGSPASTYYYIVNDAGQIYHHDGKWRNKRLKDMNKSWFKSLQDAEQRLIHLTENVI